MIFLLNFQSSFKIQNKELLENYRLVGHAILTDIGVPAKKVRGGNELKFCDICSNHEFLTLYE